MEPVRDSIHLYKFLVMRVCLQDSDGADTPGLHVAVTPSPPAPALNGNSPRRFFTPQRICLSHRLPTLAREFAQQPPSFRDVGEGLGVQVLRVNERDRCVASM